MTRRKPRQPEQVRAPELSRASKEALDAALEQTFPASDPVEILEPGGRREVAPRRAAPSKPAPS